jgi:prepilin-type N-terminal cleavage/methylation domain-containing protein
MMRKAHTSRRGFTLIELAVVIVIIGLIVGGVVVGQSLINAAAVRAQLSQIEKYNAAVNTFRGKYNALPGDIADPAASSFGFVARGPYAGEGDGNGIIEGPYNGNAAGTNQGKNLDGESQMFWSDLSTANLIEGSFTLAVANGTPALTATSTPGFKDYYPPAKLGNGNYVLSTPSRNVLMPAK